MIFRYLKLEYFKGTNRKLKARLIEPANKGTKKLYRGIKLLTESHPPSFGAINSQGVRTSFEWSLEPLLSGRCHSIRVSIGYLLYFFTLDFNVMDTLSVCACTPVQAPGNWLE